MLNDNLTLSINGVITPASSVTDDLMRAVIISLFTWRRANADDATEGQKMGWWADSFAEIQNDKTGSRLWLLARAKVVNDSINLATEYAQEALQWLQEDGIAARVEAIAERIGKDVALMVTITRNDGTVMPIRFDNLWGALNV